MTSFITYEQLQKFYSEFKKNPPKDEFTRYYREYSFMKTLIDFAQKEGYEIDVKEYEKIKASAIKKLQELGYNIK